MKVAEWSAVPAGFEPDEGVGHGEGAQEQHQQQQHQVEVVRPVHWSDLGPVGFTVQSCQ